VIRFHLGYFQQWVSAIVIVGGKESSAGLKHPFASMDAARSLDKICFTQCGTRSDVFFVIRFKPV
jgi:hypothetical protein